jgi:hypothetical protein
MELMQNVFFVLISKWLKRYSLGDTTGTSTKRDVAFTFAYLLYLVFKGSIMVIVISYSGCTVRGDDVL